MEAGHAVRELVGFARAADAILGRDGHIELAAYITAHKSDGDLIPGAGGARKLRFAVPGAGKSGGLRVIYYLHDDAVPVVALYLYRKADKAGLTARERAALKVLISGLY